MRSSNKMTDVWQGANIGAVKYVLTILGVMVCLGIAGCKAIQRYYLVPQAESAVKAHHIFLTNFHRESVLTVKKYMETTLEPDNEFLKATTENLPTELQEAQKHLREARKL